VGAALRGAGKFYVFTRTELSSIFLSKLLLWANEIAEVLLLNLPFLRGGFAY
jgi:hypothetical protein